MGDIKIAVLGAGPAGISAAYHLKKAGFNPIVYEKNKSYGGLCNSFTIDGFIFDTFAHMSFSTDPEVVDLLENKTHCIDHMPEALNYSDGNWVRNPVQNNLYGLPVDERIKIIEGFVNKKTSISINNYGDWLNSCYGEYFAKSYPYKYTRKYWTVEPEELETQWVKNRMYVPDLQEILKGAFSDDTPNVHYSKRMHYPQNGGFKSFLEPLTKDLYICYEKEVNGIFYKGNSAIIRFADGSEVEHGRVISTLPLNITPELLGNVPEDIKKASGELDYTSGYMISIGLKGNIDIPVVWFYIYDEDILPARVYLPGKKSPNNVPQGCSSLQAEVYVSKRKSLQLSQEELKEKVIKQLEKTKIIQKKNVLFADIRYEEYANIMFTPNIYKSRKKVREYLKKEGVITAGRFGEWDYLWLGQSLLSGKAAAKEVIEHGCYK